MIDTELPSSIYYVRCYAVLQLLLDGCGGENAGTSLDEEIQIPVIPKAATIHVNSYKQADSYELTFDAKDLPVDPEVIRAGCAHIYLFQTKALADDSFAIAGPTDVGERLPSRISGLFDEPSLSLSQGGRYVTIRGQDYTAFLAAKQWPPLPDRTARRIPVNKKLDVVLREMLSMADPGGFLTLEVDEGIETMPMVEAHVNAHDRGIPVEQSTSYWDVMYKTAIRCGMVIFVVGNSIVLSAPRNLDARDQSKVRRFAWGANIESLEFTRRMGRVVSPTVVMQGVDKNGRAVEAQFPGGRRTVPKFEKKAQDAAKAKTAHTTEHQKAEKPNPEGHHKKTKPSLKAITESRRDEYEYIPAGEIADLAVLEQMAEVRFRLISHGERKLVLKTAHLRDLEDAELLDLTSGDALTIDFRDADSDYVGNDAIAPSERIGYLTSRGYRPEVAKMLVTYADKTRMLRRPLRVCDATYTFTVDRGVAIELALENFMQVDAHKGLKHDTHQRSKQVQKTFTVVTGKGVVQ